MKRPLNVILSTLMLILSMPVSLAIALAMKLEDGGPIFYCQERWGLNGTRFKAYKFRTMVANSDRDFGIKQARENDPRINRVGQILRAMGLDELPQFLNIFKGEMSFVGSRPEEIGFLDTKLILASFWISFIGNRGSREKKIKRIRIGKFKII